MIFKKRLSIAGSVLAGLIGVLLAINLGFITFTRLYPDKIVDETTYQAVFLDNNQVYFGRLKSTNSQYLILSEVYYVQVSDNTSDSNSGRLVKLGEAEAHGPQNEMILNKEHVLFWENMRPDSQVVRTIQSLKSKK